MIGDFIDIYFKIKKKKRSDKLNRDIQSKMRKTKKGKHSFLCTQKEGMYKVIAKYVMI